MQVRHLNVHLKRHRRPWQSFLEQQGITGFSPSEVEPITETFAWYDQHQMVATGSLAGNVMKYIAIDPDYQEGGSMFNQVVSYVVNQASQHGYFHLMVFTKPKYVKSFQYVGFTLLAQADHGAVLETGTPGIQDYLAKISRFSQSDHSIAGIVMNANPFTRGHLALIREASQENDGVYVFVVQEEKSLFTFKERYQLVESGTADLKNVKVVPGGDYMVSSATFPAYFLKDENDVVHYQAQLDGLLFKKQIASPLKINRRYLGSEPFSNTTEIYNQELSSVLPPDVEVKIVPRAQNNAGEIISATKVRKMIATGQLDQLGEMVPGPTKQFIARNVQTLQQRLDERKHQAWK